MKGTEDALFQSFPFLLIVGLVVLVVGLVGLESILLQINYSEKS